MKGQQSAVPASPPKSARFQPRYIPPRRTTGTTPATGQDSQLVRISFTVHKEHAPALRSAVEEISNTVGGRLEGRYEYDVEQALTNAAVALGSLRAATFAAIPAGDPNYRGKK